MAKWYDIKAAANGDGPLEAVVFIYDEIGYWGTTAKDFADELKALGAVSKITVRINSGGGEVFAGIAIHNLLKSHPATVTVIIDGIAASIASVIAMAGDTVEMPANAMMMIHNPSWWASGTADEMREAADVLDQIKKSLVAAYRGKTNLDDARVSELMTASSWLTASEAKDLGFCDEVTGAVEATNLAKADPSRWAKIPEAITAKLHPAAPTVPPPPPVDNLETPMPNDGNKPTPQTPPTDQKPAAPAEIAALCQKAGFPELTAGLLTGTPTAEQVNARIEDAKQVKDACARFRRPDMARNLIAAVANGMSVETACAIANDAAAERDESIITDTTRPNGQPQTNGWAAAVAKLPQ